MAIRISGTTGIDMGNTSVSNVDVGALDYNAVNKEYADLKQSKSELAYDVDTSSYIPNTLASGAIIERGSNANGEYTKFADGTQICIHILNGYGYSLANSAYITWTVPAEFTSVPTYLASCQRGANDSIQIFARQGIVTATQSNWAHSAEPTVGVNFNLFAIGRWK